MMMLRLRVAPSALRLPKAALHAPARFFSAAPEEKKFELVYEAPLIKPVTTMKAVSVTSCVLTSVGMPLGCYYGNVTASLVGQWAMCGTVMFFGIGTTSLFHYLFKPYVLRMWVDRSSETVAVETLNLLARKKRTEFVLADVASPDVSNHPMVNFKAKDQHYFIHPEVFQDRALAERLLGKKIEDAPEDPPQAA
ncbi:hypothetical protein SPRG_08574 [Saprolegnia parasitica CBS 223.65]|uniref:Transmembrane protein 186 n=1 Tax=Saprolegnia parasitica (strain CBS 223.65) TaxID=695850 RepID=A0A067CHF5_SAPPC|nr:hypothetical protein SPRG_08574 [Saprolegnia parasitica CBS 223.65]KDO26212.1 hypothetical protein SPRG_08574 [Saprolegnia parasitica CBS 223.65]|eukprot:XP_012203204.1 hypothetical protein SPRG_08574 [Saprolegnia parasitica CBS 223.65]